MVELVKYMAQALVEKSEAVDVPKSKTRTAL